MAVLFRRVRARGARRLLALGLLVLLLLPPPGCASPFQAIDRGLAAEARLALRLQRPPRPDIDDEEEMEEPEEAPGRKSVIVGEFLAIFPGFVWHGLGHQYAGDAKTASAIREAGGWGYLLTAIGGGAVLGGYYLSKQDQPWDNYALSAYIAGGITGTIGVGFFLTAWIYDMIDTPRAVESGGRPPARGLFTKDLDTFGDDR